MTRSTSTCTIETCRKKSGVNCSFGYCKACCVARPPEAPACEERYHKRTSTPAQHASSGSISQPSPSDAPTITTSSPGLLPSAPIDSLSTASSLSLHTSEATSLPSTALPPQPSARPHAKPLHGIWAPASAEVGIADRLKHKSRREDVAVAQTRLVVGAMPGGQRGSGEVVPTRTVTFLIWMQVCTMSYTILITFLMQCLVYIGRLPSRGGAGPSRGAPTLHSSQPPRYRL